MSIYYIDNGGKLSEEFASYGIQTISPAQLLQLGETFQGTIKGLIIPCELNVNLENSPIERIDLFGVKLARELRLSLESVYPILFVSFLPLEYIKKNSVIASLIEAIGHDFMRLPASGEQIIRRLKEINSLSPTELRDVQWFSCKPDGVVNSLIHQLPVVIHKFENDPIYDAEYAKADLEACIHQIHFVVQTEPDNCLDRFRRHFNEITLENVAEACKFVKSEGEKIILELMRNNTATDFVGVEKRPWKLLMLDDELDKSSKIISLLEKKGVNVIYRNNAEGAMRALDRDEKHRNKIVLILCDYRLLEERDGGVFQQKIQGYTFLQKVGQRFQSRILSAIVYSGMPRKFLLETFKTFNIRTEIFSKADFGIDNLEAMNYIANRVAEIGDENYEAIMALPLTKNNAGWENHLHEWYIYFRSLKNYEEKELEITSYCNAWLEELRSGIQPESPLSKGSRVSPLNQKVKKCKTCNSVLTEKGHPEQVVENDFSHFISILKARRIAQFLYLEYIRHVSEKVALMEIHKRIKPKGFGESEPSRKQLSFTLGLKLSDFPLGATVEELSWLHFDRGMELLYTYRGFRKKIDRTEALTADFVLGSDYLQSILTENGFELQIKMDEDDDNGSTVKAVNKESKTNKLDYVLRFDKNSYRPYLFDKTDLNVLITWLGRSVRQENASEQLKRFNDDYCDKLIKIWAWQDLEHRGR